jgi:hypothetical protein
VSFPRILILAAVGVTLFATAASADGKRFEGFTSGSIGPDHTFVVGDGFSLVFVDHRHSYTPYRVCWHRLHHSHHRCWLGETGPTGRRDRIFTAAPSFVGTTSSSGLSTVTARRCGVFTTASATERHGRFEASRTTHTEPRSRRPLRGTWTPVPDTGQGWSNRRWQCQGRK